MGGHSRTVRVAVGIVATVVVAGCASSASPTPLPASPTPTSTPAVAVAMPTASRRENVNRALATLRRAGLVATEADELVILDLDGLRQAAAVEEPGHRRNRRQGEAGDAQ